ncbi:MAG: Eco57I restriction-modification methylase domain-containing protein [Balneola sp.]
MINKSKGAYYTPNILSDFLISHILENYKGLLPSNFKVLEPSVGDGRFVDSFIKKKANSFFSKFSIEIIDIAGEELEKAEKKLQKHSISFISKRTDFLDFQGNKYDLVIGNPPYINKKLLSKDQIEKCKKLEREEILDYGETKNIWPAFLIKSIGLLNENGILCFVLPAELLQVNYTKKLREYLLDKFERIEIFAFNELIFEDENGKKIEQDVIVLIGAKKYDDTQGKGVSFYQVDKLSDLEIPGYTEKNSNIHRTKLDKWTNYVLEDQELDFIQSKIDELELKPIKYYCEKAEVGIVTAANKYFIISKKREQKYNLENYTRPIISKGVFIQNKLRLLKKDIKKLEERGTPISLLNLDGNDSISNSNLKRYIKIGERAKLNQRYKMKTRKKWYSVPSIWVPEGVFLKRSHLFPRIIVNSAKALFTDSFYRINMKKEFKIRSLAFSFYNSLSYVMAELEGRYYGGGVLELTPNEFKESVIPYKEISNEEFKQLESILENSPTVESILNFTDPILLADLSDSDLKKLDLIRRKLTARRLKQRIPTS